MPYFARPSTFSGVSSRFSALPISVKRAESLSGGAAGGLTCAARLTSLPYSSLRPEPSWMTKPFAAPHSEAGTLQVAAAASSKHALVVARSFPQGFPEGSHRVRVARRLDAQHRILVERLVSRRVIDSHSRPIGVELFRQDHGQRRVRALPHFHLRNDQGDGHLLHRS